MSLFSTFEAVEILKRDAQIASLTAEIERLRKDLPVSFGNLTFDVSRLTAENERLRSEIKEAVYLMHHWQVFGSGEDRFNAFFKRNAEQ